LLSSLIASFQRRVMVRWVFCPRNAVVVIVARWRRFPRMIRLNQFIWRRSWGTRLEWRTSSERWTGLDPVSSTLSVYRMHDARMAEIPPSHRQVFCYGGRISVELPKYCWIDGSL